MLPSSPASRLVNESAANMAQNLNPFIVVSFSVGRGACDIVMHVL